jgi:hypothetical protein
MTNIYYKQWIISENSKYQCIKAINSEIISNYKKATNLIQLNEFYNYKNILISLCI